MVPVCISQYQQKFSRQITTQPGFYWVVKMYWVVNCDFFNISVHQFLNLCFRVSEKALHFIRRNKITFVNLTASSKKIKSQPMRFKNKMAFFDTSRTDEGAKIRKHSLS